MDIKHVEKAESNIVLDVGELITMIVRFYLIW